MPIYIATQRAFLGVVGALMLWSAPHWVADGLQLRRSNAAGALGFVALAASMVLAASILIHIGVRGRVPRWIDRGAPRARP